MSDLISRDEAIDAMANALWHYPNDGYRNLNEYKFARGLAEFGLKSVPSAQPERKKGKWIDTDNYYMRWKCSLCGCHTRDARPDFCPYCGAKMEMEE